MLNFLFSDEISEDIIYGSLWLSVFLHTQILLQVTLLGLIDLDVCLKVKNGIKMLEIIERKM